MGVAGLEPVTSSLSSKGLPSAHGTGKGLTRTPPAACTAACTSEGEKANAAALEAASLGPPPQAADALDTDQGAAPAPSADQRTQAGADAHQGGEGEGIDQEPIDQGDRLARLAAELGKLSPEDRQRLAAMLTGHQGEGQTGTA